MSPIPSSIVLDHTGITCPVVQKDLMGKLGYVDCSGDWPEIGIHADQPEVGKHLILLHELIHLTAQSLKGEGVISRQPDEKFVTHAAGRLFSFLALSGLWAGVTPEQATKFLAGHVGNAEAIEG